MCNFSYVHCSFFFMYLPKRWRACVLLFGGQATPIRMLVRKMRFGFYLFSAVVILHRESYCNSCCDYCEFPKDEAMEHLLLHASCVCVCVCVDIPRYLLPTWSPLFVRSTVSVLVIFIFGVVVSEAVQLAAFPPYLPKGRKLKSFKYLFGKLLCPLVMSILAIVWGRNFLLQSLFIFISRWGVVLQIILCINMIRTSPLWMLIIL